MRKLKIYLYRLLQLLGLIKRKNMFTDEKLNQFRNSIESIKNDLQSQIDSTENGELRILYQSFKGSLDYPLSFINTITDKQNEIKEQDKQKEKRIKGFNDHN